LFETTSFVQFFAGLLLELFATWLPLMDYFLHKDILRV